MQPASDSDSPQEAPGPAPVVQQFRQQAAAKRVSQIFRNSQSSLPHPPQRSAAPRSHPCQSVPIRGLPPYGGLPRALSTRGFISVSFPLPHPPVFSISYKIVRISLKINTFKSLIVQSLAHSLSLFSCKSFVCITYANQRGGYTEPGTPFPPPPTNAWRESGSLCLEPPRRAQPYFH